MTGEPDGIAVVTGAGGGLGRALALGLVAKNVVVAGLGRCPESLGETAALAESSGRFYGFACDIADYPALRETFKAIRQIGSVSILINNAAVYPRRDFLQETPESFMETIAVNLGGMAACSRHALADMIRSGTGRILNVSTFADMAPLPASSAYCVSKGAGRILSRALVADICDRFPRIVINDWMPGILNTKIGVSGGLDPEYAARWGVELALWRDPALTGTLWERDREVLPPQPLKRRIFNRLIMPLAAQPRRLAV